MERTKVIGKNIGVIALSIIVLIIGGIAENIAKQCLSGQYLQLIIPALVRIAVTIVLAWFVSGKLLKINPNELGIKIRKIDIKLILISIALPILVLLFYAYILPGKAYIARPGRFWISLIGAFFSLGITA